MKASRADMLLIICMPILFGVASVKADEDSEGAYSRQELFSAMTALESGTVELALPPSFGFPDSVRSSSTFGIDVSNNNEKHCKCQIKWGELAKDKISFVYLKSSEGATYTDKTYVRSLPILRSLEDEGKLNFGVYHFLSSRSDVTDQIKHFIDVAGNVAPNDLPPSLDLEGDPEDYTAACPADATLKFKLPDGSFYKKCDRWYTVSGPEILARANKWLDAIRSATKREPLLYTNYFWWNARIGKPDKINELHAQLIWISDYSKGGLASEKPRVPANKPWILWQFSQTATANDGAHDLILDGSIYEKDLIALKRDLGVKP